ncbi:MAG: hypothetical protein NVS3B20_13110 [Polyangiales bacterium]
MLLSLLACATSVEGINVDASPFEGGGGGGGEVAPRTITPSATDAADESANSDVASGDDTSAPADATTDSIATKDTFVPEASPKPDADNPDVDLPDGGLLSCVIDSDCKSPFNCCTSKKCGFKIAFACAAPF